MYDDRPAEECVVEACRLLSTMQIPLNSVTVPNAAIALFNKKLDCSDASQRIYNQINTMILNKKLKASTSQIHAWELFEHD